MCIRYENSLSLDTNLLTALRIFKLAVSVRGHSVALQIVPIHLYSWLSSSSSHEILNCSTVGILKYFHMRPAPPF